MSGIITAGVIGGVGSIASGIIGGNAAKKPLEKLLKEEKDLKQSYNN